MHVVSKYTWTISGVLHEVSAYCTRCSHVLAAVVAVPPVVGAVVLTVEVVEAVTPLKPAVVKAVVKAPLLVAVAILVCSVVVSVLVALTVYATLTLDAVSWRSTMVVAVRRLLLPAVTPVTATLLMGRLRAEATPVANCAFHASVDAVVTSTPLIACEIYTLLMEGVVHEKVVEYES